MLKNYNKYLAVSEAERLWGFYVTTTGFSKTATNRSYPNNREHPADHSFTWNKGRMLDGYYLVFISKGEGVFESAQTETCAVKAGTCFFLFPGVWHRYKPDPALGWEEYWIGFKGSYPDDLMSKGFFNPAKPFIDVGMNETVLHLFHALIHTVQGATAGYNKVLAGLTLQILGLVQSISVQEEHEDDETKMRIAKAKFLLQESLEGPVAMEELAKELPMGYSHFRKSFKRLTGQSPNQYHLQLRLKKAKELFASTSLSITEVAYKTGFDSVFYFSKLFKKKNGVAPKFYRAGNANLQ